ncbi:hypothetical protein [uncultured Mitsuokella sp.]|uniref:PglD-related sugar-binding protein n=1 Tax=uncultured Mitsuokella sp. TaxID=453120 RepID=UPI0026762871|nr:hypothetical protein [uncultured Mitsuokella sp.]
MKEKWLLVGAGGFGRVVSEHISQLYDCAFIDDGKAKGAVICGVPVIGSVADLTKLYPTYQKLIVTIGNNGLRERIYEQAAQIGYVFPNIILPSVYISPYAKVGQGCIFLNNAVIQNGTRVGDGVILNPGVEIHHDSEVKDYALIYTNTVVRSLATVGKRAHIGSTLTISNEVIVPDDAKVENGHTLLT